MVEKEVIPSNPFKGLVQKVVTDDRRNQYIDEETILKVTVYFLFFICLSSHFCFPILTLRWQIVKNGQNGEAYLLVFATKLFIC
jgi:hypothetical protein